MKKTQLALNLAAARGQKGWSQAGSAKKIGIKHKCLASYEEGRCEPKTRVLIRAMKAYDIPLDRIDDIFVMDLYPAPVNS